MHPTRERRTIRGPVETRDLTPAEKSAGYIGALTGIIPLDTDSVTLRDRRLNSGQPFVERIAPHAFAEAADVMGMAGHTDATLAAFARQGVNLTLVETPTELRWEALLPDTSAGRDLLQQARLGIVRGTSFEFDYGASDRWEKRADGTTVRTVLKGRLSTVNPVVWPAYDTSDLTVSMRAAGDEQRGQYLKPELGGLCDYYDPTLTPDTKFALSALGRATYALTDALEYLRAAPAGDLASFASAEVAAASAAAQQIIDWLAAHGATVNPSLHQHAAEQLAAARAAAPAAPPLTHPDHDRERRVRILNLGSR